MVATTSIARGSLILSESPLFTLEDHGKNAIMIASKLRALPREQQQVFFSLHNAWAQQISPLLGIVKTNSHALGVRATACGIFPECSRFNHSCVPNAAYSWDGIRSKENIYAVKDIAAGEQITVSYLGSKGNECRSSRQLKLMLSWRFYCCCEACNKSEEEIAASDAKRQEIARLDEVVGDGVLIMVNPARMLGYCRKILQLYKEEGLEDVSLYRSYYDALQACVAHGDMARASAFAALALEVKETCEGKDAMGLGEIKSLIKHPENHRLAGTSFRWRLRAKFTREIGSDGFEEWLWSRAEK